MKHNVKKRPLFLHAKQLEFRQSDAWCRGFVAGRSSGKSTIGARDILLRAQRNEPWCCVSRSFPDVMKVTWPVFEKEARQLGVWIRGIKTPVPKVYFRTQDGGTASLTFSTATHADDLRGPSWAGMWLDECSQMHEDVKTYGIPALRHEGRMGQLLMTFTPRGRRHWTFEMFYEQLPQDGSPMPSGIHGGSDWAAGDYAHEPFGDDDALVRDSSLADGLAKFGGKLYRPKPNTFLVHATTQENPFAPAEFYDLIRQNYTSTLAVQELGGQFIDIEGLIFQRWWFEPVPQVPRDAMRVRYWDKAATHGDGCYTAGVLMARDHRDLYYIEDVVRGQWSYHEREAIIEQTAHRDADRYDNEVLVYVEQEPGSGGKESAQQTLKRLSGFPVYLDVVSQSNQLRTIDNLKVPGNAKITRAQPLAAQSEAGNVKLIPAPWSDDFLDELASFPESKFSDQVDATSGAFNKLANKAAGSWQAPSRATHASNPRRFGIQLDPTKPSPRATRSTETNTTAQAEDLDTDAHQLGKHLLAHRRDS